jgi:hypothetical protein
MPEFVACLPRLTAPTFPPFLQPLLLSSSAAYLVQKKLRSVDQDEALALMKRGATLLDVRMAADFAKERAAGAVNAPLFQLTAGDAAWVRAAG